MREQREQLGQLAMTDREAAWSAVHDAIARLPGWAIGPASWHGETGLWHVVAVDLAPRGRQAQREAIEATGPTEVKALEALVGLLEGRVGGE